MNRLSSLFARRYLLSPKSHSVINIISRVSAFAIGVPVAAMVILLSVFNGFEGLVRQMYNDFDPDLTIRAAQGKVFPDSRLSRGELLSVPGVEEVSSVLEDNVLLEYRGRQFIGTVRGVDSLYSRVVPIEGMVSAGEYRPMLGTTMQALVGEGLAYNLGIQVNLFDPLRAYVPRRGDYNPFVPVENFRSQQIYPSGLFMLDAETDSKYMIAPIDFTRTLLDHPDGVSEVMVRVAPDADPKKVRAALEQMSGDDFRVLTRYEMKASLYSIMAYEKWGIFLIAMLVMVIASFSVVGSLVMLVIEKRDDIRTLATMGAGVGFLRSVFLKEGMLISTAGAAGGMAVGLLVCGLQQWFGLVKIPARTFLIDAYPVVVQGGDLLLVAAAFIAVNYIIIKFTVVKMIPRTSIRI